MTTALIHTISALQQDAHHQFGQALRALYTGFVAAQRRRYEERRMLLAVQGLDHPGVLADAKAGGAERHGR